MPTTKAQRVMKMLHRYPISSCHSINRVKQTLAIASNKTTVRAVRIRIACLQWLGRW